MRLAASLAALLAATAFRGGCRPEGTYDPCAGKACGDPCRLCAPDDEGCLEPAVPPTFATVCDAQRRCVVAEVMNGPVSSLCHDPCAGKACGDACSLCAPGDTGCVEPASVKHCDPGGRCLEGSPAFACPHPDCAGKACGDPCNPCGPDAVCPTFMASACDRFGGCSGAVPWLCHDPCAGKPCGASCSLCPPGATGCFETAVVKACDADGRCVSAPAELHCPDR